MSVTDRIHGRYIHNRRVRRLRDHLAAEIPQGARVLDVGCGDGLLAHLIAQERPDIDIKGVDVLVRAQTHIPVARFDGKTLPYADASQDVVMFIDVLHHTNNPEQLLREAIRTASRAILIKDHTLNGLLAGQTLRFMDRVGNARHGVELPYNYWPRDKWIETCRALGVTIGSWTSELKLYPRPADWLFGRSLHFVARIDLDR